MASPIEQFDIKPIFQIGAIGSHDIAFTNSSAYMLLVVVLTATFLLAGTRLKSLVPGRWQSSVEILYELIFAMLQNSAGKEGLRFFPLVFSLFIFILVANLVGMIPYAFTVTSHLIVTFALAMIVFMTVIVYGFWKHGLGFFRLFFPKGIPVVLAPFIVPIEVISFFSRPISHAVRLFAVMLAGHITLKVFAGFVAGLAGHSIFGAVGAVLPLFFAVVITALELLMAFLQAYVFAMLTCIYLNDAIHPSH